MIRMTLTASTLALGLGSAAQADMAPDKQAVIDTYADIAQAAFDDSLAAA